MNAALDNYNISRLCSRPRPFQCLWAADWPRTSRRSGPGPDRPWDRADRTPGSPRSYSWSLQARRSQASRAAAGLQVRQDADGAHDDMRQGATTLFAVLDVTTGKVVGQCLPRRRNDEFLSLLRHPCLDYRARVEGVQQGTCRPCSASVAYGGGQVALGNGRRFAPLPPAGLRVPIGWVRVGADRVRNLSSSDVPAPGAQSPRAGGRYRRPPAEPDHIDLGSACSHAP